MNKLLISFLLLLSTSVQVDRLNSYLGVQFGTSESSLDGIGSDPGESLRGFRPRGRAEQHV